MKQGETKIYTVPLRKGFVDKPKWKRTNAAIKTLKHFIEKHTKMTPKIQEELNEFIWSRGNKNPPARVKIRVMVEAGFAYANLETAEIKTQEKEEEEDKKEKKKQEKKPKKKKEAKEKKKKGKKKPKKKAKKKKAKKKKKSKDYKSMTKKEIYEIAKKLDISGRSKMNKKELIKAVKKAKK